MGLQDVVGQGAHLRESYRCRALLVGGPGASRELRQTRLDNAYRERVDPALRVAFSVVPEPGEPASIKMLAWTTTPWTLPANLALCVHPTLDYAVKQRGGERYVLAAEAVRRYRQDLAGFHEVGMVKGAKFAGRASAAVSVLRAC